MGGAAGGGGGAQGGRGAFEGKGPQRRSDRPLEEVAKAVGGDYYRLQMPLRLSLGVRETVAGRRLGALDGGSPFQCTPETGVRGGGVLCSGGGGGPASALFFRVHKPIPVGFAARGTPTMALPVPLAGPLSFKIRGRGGGVQASFIRGGGYFAKDPPTQLWAHPPHC